MIKIFEGLFDSNEKQIAKIQKIVDQINLLEKDVSRLSDEKLREKTEYFRKQIGVNLDSARQDFNNYNREELKKILDSEKVRLRDISVGGICFFSDRVFLAKQRIYLDLHGIKEGLNVQAQVLRKQRENRRYSYRYRYGCRFIGLSNLNQRIICEYVFKKELENYRKEQEKDLKIYD